MDPEMQKLYFPGKNYYVREGEVNKNHRSQNQTGDDYMSQLKYTVLGCNITNSEERIRDLFIKGITNLKCKKELLKVASDNTPIDELSKVVHKLEAVKLSTNGLQNLST